MPMRFTIDFACSPEQLFPYLVEPDKMLKWMCGVTKIEPITDGPPGVGQRAKIWIKEGKKESEYETVVTIFEPNRRISVDMTGGCFGGKTTMKPDYVLSVSPSGGTTMEYTCGVETSSVMFRVMDVLFRPFMKRMVKKMMVTLKEQAEGAAGAAAA